MSRLGHLGRRLRGDPPEPPELPPPEAAVPHQGRIGICCSGGGIRSAAYSLGALAVLRDQGLFDCRAGEKRPLVSAVSGGSYIAASFATVAASLPAGSAVDVFGPNSPEERHLRNHSSYMAPGLGGKLRLTARVVLGMVPNLLLVGLVVYGAGWLLGALWAWLVPALARDADPDPGRALVVAGGLALAGVLVAAPDLVARVRDSYSARLQTWSLRLLGAALAVLVVLAALPELVVVLRKGPAGWIRDVSGFLPLAPEEKSTRDLLVQLDVLAILGTMASAVWAFVARRGRLVALALAIVAGPLAVTLPLLLFAETTVADGISGAELTVLLVLVAVAALLWVFVDLNQWSLNPFYRRRLSTAFFVRRKDDEHVREQDFRERLKFSALDTGERFPDLIVCAAANVSDPGATPPGRGATPFRFSRDSIGGPLVQDRSAAAYERAAERFGRDATLPAAVAVSGAAVSPAMGKKTLRAFTMLLALTNVRLGVWLPNPRCLPEEGLGATLRERAVARVPGDGGRAKPLLDWLCARRPGPHYLFKEMFGRMKLTDRYLYVTDGGHYDNLGLVELLREGCTTIFCLDGGGDAAGTYRALGEAVALARSELGVDVEIDPLAIAAQKKAEFAPTDHVLGQIRYRGTTGEAPRADGAVEGTGLLVYCRAAVTADAPWDVRDFRFRDPRFPIHSTLDQLFNDQKFESYRALGAWTARRAVTSWQRRVIADALRRALIERARAEGWVRHEELVREVIGVLRRDFALPSDPPWAPVNLFPELILELAAAEERDRRPPLTRVVQERRPKGALRQELMPVWEYWRGS